MIKTSDFARMQGVTPRAVRKLLQTYASELEGHYEKKGQNGTWIDDFSQEFLRSKMLHNPIIVYDDTTAPLIQEKQNLEHKVEQLKDTLSEAYKALADERAESKKLLFEMQTELSEYRLLAAGREEAEARAKEAEAVNGALKDQADKANQKAADLEEQAKALKDKATELEKLLAVERQKNEALESRTLADYIKELFRKKKE